LNAVAAAGERAHEPALLVVEGGSCVEGGGDLGFVGQADAVAASADRAVEQLALDAKQFAGCVAAFAGDGIERDDLLAVEERVGSRFKLAHVSA